MGAPDSLPPPAGNETGTVYAELWRARFTPRVRDDRGRFRRKART